jgi:anti-sigma-K factor RskA
MNQQYGSTNWYSSALGAGVASAGVAIIGGLVNAMNRPEPVQVQQQQPQVIYVNQGQVQPQQGTTYDLQRGNNCQMQTVYDQYGNPRNVNVCP